jgi:LPXTG-motif cell wall-anchored protein
MKKARWVTAAAGTAVLAAGFTLPATAAYAGGGGNGGGSSNGNGGLLSVLSGNTVNAPVSAPLNVCGIAVGLLGGAAASCAGGASSSTTISGPGSGGGDNGNAGVASVGSGNTVNAPVSVPVNVCGVSAAVAGAANSGCQGGAASTTSIDEPTSGGHKGSGGIASIGSGNTINAPISAPVNVCGISLALIGLADSGCCGGSSSTSSVNQPPSSQPSSASSTPPGNGGSTPPGNGGGGGSNGGTNPGGGSNGGGQNHPGGGTQNPPGNGGTQSGAGAATTTMAAESLPITGANIAGMLVAALGSLGLGGASLVTARRRRHSEAA